MGNLRAALLVLVVAAVARCDNRYPLAPTACDDYCLATQRADCEEDWPSECVRHCEYFLSPARFPNCTGEFATALACYEALDDDDFGCVADTSEPLPGLCTNEERSLEICIEPLAYLCTSLCEDRRERCPENEYGCLEECKFILDECEDAAVRWLYCELADTSACVTSPNCTALSVEVSDCIASLTTPS